MTKLTSDISSSGILYLSLINQEICHQIVSEAVINDLCKGTLGDGVIHHNERKDKRSKVRKNRIFSFPIGFSLLILYDIMCSAVLIASTQT